MAAEVFRRGRIPTLIVGTSWDRLKIDRLQRRIETLAERSIRPVKRIRLRINRDVKNRARGDLYRISATLDVDGAATMNACAQAATVDEAGEVLHNRLRSQLERRRMLMLWNRRRLWKT